MFDASACSVRGARARCTWMFATRRCARWAWATGTTSVCGPAGAVHERRARGRGLRRSDVTIPHQGAALALGGYGGRGAARAIGAANTLTFALDGTFPAERRTLLQPDRALKATCRASARSCSARRRRPGGGVGATTGRCRMRLQPPRGARRAAHTLARRQWLARDRPRSSHETAHRIQPEPDAEKDGSRGSA